MSSPNDPERFIRENTGASRDEVMEGLRESLRDFDLSLPAPAAVREFAPATSQPIVDAQAGFSLPAHAQIPHPGQPEGSSRLTIYVFFNAGFSLQTFHVD